MREQGGCSLSTSQSCPGNTGKKRGTETLYLYDRLSPPLWQGMYRYLYECTQLYCKRCATPEPVYKIVGKP